VFREHGSEQTVKEAGLLQVEGKEYIVSDGDLMNIRFNV
jgi:ribosome-binding ATPase YchF (GTP1/OBG family)